MGFYFLFDTMKKNKVAVTGNIGSGKSSFCKFLEEMNYAVIKADEIAKDLMANDPQIKSKLIKHFGTESFTQVGINRAYLSEKVFSDKLNLAKINSIVHPAVIKKVKRLMDDSLKNSSIVFHEAALIYEAEMENLFEYVVLISSDQEIRMERKRKYDGMLEEEFLRRELNQIPEDEKKKCADFIFSNNGSLNELKVKAELLIKILSGMI